MRKEITQTGKSVDEAIQSACLRLGASLEECEFEIIDLPKTQFFGLRKVPAKVKVWRPLTEQEKKAALAKKKAAEQPVEKPEPKVEKPQEKQAVKKETVKEKPQPKMEKPKEEKPKKAERTQRREKPRKPAVKAEKPAATADTKMEDFSQEDNVKIAAAKDYVEMIMESMGIDGEIAISPLNGGVCIAINGKGLGTIIGRRGETLNAVQYLTGLIANRLEGDYLRITVDAGDYRLKRNKSLEDIARKAASEVKRTGYTKTLDSMNPAERRIVHSTIAEIEGVSSSSVGKDPHRRVVVSSPTSKTRQSRSRQQPRNRKDDRRDDRRKDNRRPKRQRDDRRSPRNVAPELPKEPIITPETKAETPLYGKVDLDLD